MSKKAKIQLGVAILIIILAVGGTAGYIYYHKRAIARKPPCDKPSIKGNINYRTGIKIYHAPWDRDYDKTVIDTSAGERMFCTEKEAQAAGWRHARTN